MANINLGKVALSAAGIHTTTESYEKLDIVNYQGDSYLAKRNVPVGITTGNNEYWQLLAAKGETGTSIGDIIIASTTQPYQPENKLWIREDHDEEYEVLTTEDIDDTAGEGDADVVWSADKSYSEVNKSNEYNLQNYDGEIGCSINSTSGKVTGNGSCTTVYLKCYPNTIYKVTKNAGSRFIVGDTTDIPASNMQTNSFIVNNTASEIIYKTSAQAKYLVAFVYYSVSDGDKDTMMASLKINELTSVDLVARKLANGLKYGTEGAVYIGNFDLDYAITPNVDISGTASSGGAAWSQIGYKHILTFDSNTIPSGNYYGYISWNIKNLFGKGIKLRFTITNQNGNNNGWYLGSWHLSQSKSSWGSGNKIKQFTPNSYGGNTAAYKSVFEIDLDTDFSDITPASYDNIYLVTANYPITTEETFASNVLTIEVKAITSDGYIIADELKNAVEKENVDLLFWGDSLTAGAGGEGTNYPDVCGQILNKTVLNCGVGGETANTISARQGGNAMIVPAGAINGEYSMTELKDIFGGFVRPLRQGSGKNSGNKIFIDGEECTLSITQTSSTSQDAVYTISGYTGGTSAIPKLARFAGSSYNGHVVVIFVGTNGSTVGADTSVNARITIIDSMINHIPHKRYLILGLSRGTDETQDNEDAILIAKYGNNFFPTRRMLVNYGMTIVGLTPTTQDLTDIANGTVPTSLRIAQNNIHFNAYGYTALGKLLADKIRSLGYF